MNEGENSGAVLCELFENRYHKVRNYRILDRRFSSGAGIGAENKVRLQGETASAALEDLVSEGDLGF